MWGNGDQVGGNHNQLQKTYSTMVTKESFIPRQTNIRKYQHIFSLSSGL